jgi:hypothetical protein
MKIKKKIKKQRKRIRTDIEKKALHQDQYTKLKIRSFFMRLSLSATPFPLDQLLPEQQ